MMMEFADDVLVIILEEKIDRFEKVEVPLSDPLSTFTIAFNMEHSIHH